MFKKRRLIRWGMLSVFAMLVTLIVATYSSMQAIPHTLIGQHGDINKQQFLDRHGLALNITYANPWNVHDLVPYHDIPPFMIKAIVTAEDKRFFEHQGVDWLARLAAVKENVLMINRRGASTITEQVVKAIHVRPRNGWTRWVEGFEAQQLEKHFSKIEILEFYLNQVPYAAQRRGIKQAAAYYFDRDLSTLSKKEMMALAVMVRAPKWYDPREYPENLNRAIKSLAKRMRDQGWVTDQQLTAIDQQGFDLKKPRLHVNAAHFIAYAKKQAHNLEPNQKKIHTTLDVNLQNNVQQILDQRLRAHSVEHVQNGAVLVVDHHTNEILAWVTGYAGDSTKPFSGIDAVLVPRQPGSSLKPFLYASAMENGWQAATLVSDTPLQEEVGVGLHVYQNYSRMHYGTLSVREALGNSLNIPAVRAIQFVGTEPFLNFLHNAGIQQLQRHPDVYGHGLALGNGEVTLYELVQAYTTLARMGEYQPLSVLEGQSRYAEKRRVINTDVASLIADILSDPHAREKEFGFDSILNFPHQTAVKTGTSSDYRDAWALAYNDRYTVGVWFGNLDYSAMHEVTGSKGPAIVLRTVFNELNRGRVLKPLYMSPNLQRRSVCGEVNEGSLGTCQTHNEWYLPEVEKTEPEQRVKQTRILKPSDGLRIAMDPRVPDEHEVFEFELSSEGKIEKVEWYLNDTLVAQDSDGRYPWAVQKGAFEAQARVYYMGVADVVVTDVVSYFVR